MMEFPGLGGRLSAQGLTAIGIAAGPGHPSAAARAAEAGPIDPLVLSPPNMKLHSMLFRAVPCALALMAAGGQPNPRFPRPK